MKLSVIISNRNDTTMLGVTIRSCIEELRAIGHEHSEIIIVDNSDRHIYAKLSSFIPTKYISERLVKVYRQDFPCLFTARELAAEKASGEYIVCLDSHMLVGRDMLTNLWLFMERHRNDPTIGFAHAPINWMHQHEGASKHDRDMSVNELGDWGAKCEKERTITWKGMPWICRRDWFLDKKTGLGSYGALADHRISWGGGDMHIGIKPWLLGFKNWAVSCTPGIHISPGPNAGELNNYRLYKNSGNGIPAIGFLISCYILGGESMMERNRAALDNKEAFKINTAKEWQRAINLGKDEKAWLDERKVMSFKQLLATQPWNQTVN